MCEGISFFFLEKLVNGSSECGMYYVDEAFHCVTFDDLTGVPERSLVAVEADTNSGTLCKQQESTPCCVKLYLSQFRNSFRDLWKPFHIGLLSQSSRHSNPIVGCLQAPHICLESISTTRWMLVLVLF